MIQSGRKEKGRKEKKERKEKREKKRKRGERGKKGERRKKEIFFVEFGPEQKLPLDERRAPAATAPALCAAAPRRRRPGA